LDNKIMQNMNTKEYTIDATGQTLGRIATRVATILRGKDTPGFRTNIVADVRVLITNASKMKITGSKMKQKKYSRYSGYPGGLKQPTMTQVIEKKGYKQILETAIKGMMPANKLRPLILKKLTISE